jgi:hypothetical protein
MLVLSIGHSGISKFHFLAFESTKMISNGFNRLKLQSEPSIHYFQFIERKAETSGFLHPHLIPQFAVDRNVHESKPTGGKDFLARVFRTLI